MVRGSSLRQARQFPVCHVSIQEMVTVTVVAVTHLLSQRDLLLLLCRVCGRNQVVDGEEEEEQLHGRANGIILVAGTDVADDY